MVRHRVADSNRQVNIETSQMQRSHLPVNALCLTLAARQQAAGPQLLSESDLATIQAATDAYIAAFLANNSEGLAALYAEDAILAPRLPRW
jgi:hypothetical protein